MKMTIIEDIGKTRSGFRPNLSNNGKQETEARAFTNPVRKIAY
jgi:hypothetical protein